MTSLNLLQKISIFASLVLFSGGIFAASDIVKVQPEIGISDEVHMSDAVRDECALQTKVPHFINEYSKNVELVAFGEDAAGKVLQLEIKHGAYPERDRLVKIMRHLGWTPKKSIRDPKRDNETYSGWVPPSQSVEWIDDGEGGRMPF